MLTPKQEIFAKEYLVDLNGTQAAIRAGYAPASAEVQASRLLSNANIQNFISEQQGKRAKRLEITVDDLVRELEEARALAFSTGKAGPAVQATMGKAKLLGMDKQLIDHTSSDGTMTPKPAINISKEAIKDIAQSINDGI